jgi:hypothetical protein
VLEDDVAIDLLILLLPVDYLSPDVVSHLYLL